MRGGSSGESVPIVLLVQTPSGGGEGGVHWPDHVISTDCADPRYTPFWLSHGILSRNASPFFFFSALRWGKHVFLSKYYLYSFAYILPRPSIFSRIFSNIENIFVTRQVDGGKKSPKYTVASPKPPGNAQNLKISACIDPKPVI